MANRKRKRDDDVVIEESDLFEKLTRIGDKTGIESQIEDLQDALLATIETKSDFILDTLFKCVTQLTVKTSLYTTVVGLVNCEHSKFGEEILEEAVRLLLATIRENEWNSASLLVRFICDFVNTGTVDAADVNGFLLELLKECNPSEPYQRSDTYCYLVLNALPWCAKSLQAKCPGGFKMLQGKLQDFFDQREFNKASNIFLEGHGSNTDMLDIMWGHVNSFVDTGFKCAATLTPWTAFEEEFAADSNTRHHIPAFKLPVHEDANIYADIPTALHIFYTWDEKTKKPEEMDPKELQELEAREKDSELLHFTHRMRIRPIDRMVTQQYVCDTLYFWNSSREDCVKKLRLLPVKGSPEHVVVEAILSSLFMTPQTPFAHVYYASILIDLCKLEPNYPVIVAEALEALYNYVPRLDNEMVDRLTTLMAYVLANFGFKWFWEDWASILETDDVRDSTCKKLFIYEVFSAMLRLSYRERLLDVIPAVFHKFIPDNAKHCFKWDVKRYRDKEMPPFKSVAESVYNAIHSGNFDCDEITLEMDRLDWNDEMKPDDKVEVLIHCIMVNGIETITHQMNAFKKYKPTLHALVDSNRRRHMELRLKIIQAATNFWEKSPQHKCITIRQLLDLQIVEPVDAVHWLFHPSVTQYWERAYPWEIIRMTIDTLLVEIMSTFKDLRKMERSAQRMERELQEGADDEVDPEEKEKEIQTLNRKAAKLRRLLAEDLIEHMKLVFFDLFKGFVKVLSDHYKKVGSRDDKKENLTLAQKRARTKDYVWHKSAKSHFNEMGRKYYMFIYPWLDQMRSDIFQDVDVRIADAFESWSKLGCRRWCVARGFNSSNFQNNICLHLFMNIVKEATEGEA